MGYCTNCGAQLPENARFCYSCNTRQGVGGDPSTSSSRGTASQEPKPDQATTSQAMYCTNCGAKLHDNAMYCTACGTKVVADTETDEQPPMARHHISWQLGVVVGACIVALLGIVIWQSTHLADSSSEISPPESAPAATEPNVYTPLEEISIGGVSDPGILPSSPFYFLKGISRSVQYAFTSPSDDKAALKLRYANQDALAIRALCFAGQYAEAAQECMVYQGNFFDSLVQTVTTAKCGGDVQSLMTNLVVAHQGHSLVLADALTVDDALLREAVISAVAYTSAPLEQVIQWTSGPEAAAAFHAKLRNDFSPVGAYHWEDIEDQLGLGAKEAAILANAMGENANADSMPVVTSLKADAYQVGPGASSLITCDAIDLGGDVLRYEWLATGGEIVGDGQTATWTAPTEPGLYAVSVVVSDESGSQTRKAVNIRVEASDYEGMTAESTAPAAARPTIAASPSSVSIVRTVGQEYSNFPATPREVALGQGGPPWEEISIECSDADADYLWRARVDASWLNHFPACGSFDQGFDSFSIWAATDGLEAGTYTGTISLRIDGFEGVIETIDVTLEMQP